MNIFTRIGVSILALSLLLIIVPVTITQEDDPILAILDSVIEFVNSGEADTVEDFISPDLIIHFVDSRPDREGVEGFLEWIGIVRAILPDVNASIDQHIVEGERMAVLLSVTGTHTGEVPGMEPTGNEVYIQAMWIIHVDDGKIVEWWQLEDLLDTYTQLGMMPQEESNTDD